jgi:hypothetical protein
MIIVQGLFLHGSLRTLHSYHQQESQRIINVAAENKEIKHFLKKHL